MKKFGIWLAGILSTIIAGAGVYYITLPKPPVVFEGMVYSGSSPVAKAMVELELKANGPGGGVYHDWTDENGAYRLEFAGLKDPSAVTFHVTATGFQDYGPQAFPSAFGTDNRMDIALTQLTAVAGAGTAPAAPVAIPPDATPPATSPGSAAAAPSAPTGLAAAPATGNGVKPNLNAISHIPVFVSKSAAKTTFIKIK
jgi:hypothetical protein